MAEDVNFPLDQGSRTSAFQGLREASQKTEKSQQAKSQENEVTDSDRARENQEAAEDIAPAERRELQSNRQEVSRDAEIDARNPRSQGSAGANELSRISEGTARKPEENPRPDDANDLTNTDRINEFQNGARIDSVQEAVAQAGEDATSGKRENPARPLQGGPSIRDTTEAGRPTQGRERLEEDIKNAPPSTEERVAKNLEQTPANDAKVQQRIQEERVEKAETRVKNEPALKTPEQSIDPVEPPSEPLREAIDNNPLRGPKPSELKEEPDATAVETERGQNVSNLI
jgi:hypothetical protein